MSEFAIMPSDASSGPEASFPDCRWVVEPPSPFLSCAVHGVRRPWDRPGECGAGPATLCQVCLREVVPCADRFSWTFMCPTCERIEVTLAAGFNAPALTPHRGQSGTQAETLFGRRFPDRVHQLEVEFHPMPGSGVQRLVTRDRLDGPDPVLLLRRHAEGEFGRLGGSVPVTAIEWLAARPASPRASAEAYQCYIVWQHDWLLADIPRLRDHDWLAAIAAGAMEWPVP